ncbi:molybdopterin-binding protein [Roseovarius dicentrarchi]|uniref:molybdopterin-binding protein n=1 Tax=Roseovarius dicentrarchi TaxID=2250573 RepID=UPI000DEA8335|nr:molybdopterin-binding protein [Roseovarius dicentrarchi]
MKFGPVPLAEAGGAILAHSMRAIGPGAAPYRIAKGTTLEAQHLRDLAKASIAHVIAARLEPGDVHENTAAEHLADAILTGSSGLRARSARTGRVNLVAHHAGAVSINAAAILAANMVDPGITIATVPVWHRIAAGGLVATIKIIPYAVPGDRLAEACAAARGAIDLHGAQAATLSLIETRIGPDAPAIKGRRAMAARAANFGAALTPRLVVPHQAGAIAAALSQAPGDVLLILTGSATSDIGDVAPEGLRLAGGQVDHYGMPVDPGNLLFLGRLGARPVIGLPGCARSPALNGADWVLERVICGIPVTPADIAAMGVGGLLKEIPSRPMPRRSKNLT